MNASSISNFYGRDFLTTKDVLTPRPETEAIIDEVLTLCGIPILPGVRPPKPLLDPNHLTILDVGTGSGCIAITLKLALGNAIVYATDISEKALQIATKNARSHKADITIRCSNLLDQVEEKTIPTPDLIVANLPYVNPEWDWLDRASLKNDPDIALYAADNGLALIKSLIGKASHLKIKRLILEADPSQHRDIIKYAKNHEYQLKNTRGFVLSFCNLRESR